MTELSAAEAGGAATALAPEGRERPLRADARRNRVRILDAARAEFAERGGDAQIDDVARRAGVGVGTVYRHFPTKEELMAALVRDKFGLFADNLREALAEGGEPFEALAGVLRRNGELCACDVAVQQALSGGDPSVLDRAQAEMGTVRELTGELVARAQAAGTMRSDVTADDIPMLMCGVSATMTRSGFDWRRHLELVIAMLQA